MSKLFGSPLDIVSVSGTLPPPDKCKVAWRWCPKSHYVAQEDMFCRTCGEKILNGTFKLTQFS